jgi:hypothetical protein
MKLAKSLLIGFLSSLCGMVIIATHYHHTQSNGHTFEWYRTPFRVDIPGVEPHFPIIKTHDFREGQCIEYRAVDGYWEYRLISEGVAE